MLDLLGRPQNPRRETPHQRRFTQPLQPREEHRLRNALPLDHAFERGLHVQIAPEILKHGPSASRIRCPTSPIPAQPSITTNPIRLRLRQRQIALPDALVKRGALFVDAGFRRAHPFIPAFRPHQAGLQIDIDQEWSRPVSGLGTRCDRDRAPRPYRDRARIPDRPESNR